MIFSMASLSKSFIFLIFFSFCAPVPSSFSGAIKTTFLDPRTGILIQSFPEKSMFYESWQTPPISGKATPLKVERISRDFLILQKSLARFPADFLRFYLERIYLLDSLSFYGLSFGGTNDDVTLFLTNADHYPPDFLEKTFYHEFSSILLRAHPELLDQAGWKKANPPEFRYKSGGVQALRKNQHSLRWKKKYHRQGFLAQYATASLEEDFNLFSESLFFSNRLFTLAEKYPAIRKKLELLLAFYSRLSPLFTREYFFTIDKQTHPEPASDLRRNPDDRFFHYENGFFAHLGGERWIMRKDHSAPVLFRQEKKDAHYLYLRSIKSPLYVSLPFNPKSLFFYEFLPQGNTRLPHKRTKIP